MTVHLVGVVVYIVCVYCSQNIPCQRRFELENPNFECIWLWVRFSRLPRPLSAISVCVVYNAPGRAAEALVNLEEYLMNTVDSIRNRYLITDLCFLVILIILMLLT